MVLTEDNFEEFYRALPIETKLLWDEFEKDSEEGFNYKQLEQWQEDFRPHGITFKYSLDAVPYDITLNK